MKKILPILIALMLPAALFAQGQSNDREMNLLKGFGLDAGQISQVQAIEKSTRDTVRADLTHIRLVEAQIAEAMLPSASGPDVQAVNTLIEKKGQFRIDIDKTLMSAQLQLRKLMGDEHFAQYRRLIREGTRRLVRSPRLQGPNQGQGPRQGGGQGMAP